MYIFYLLPIKHMQLSFKIFKYKTTVHDFTYNWRKKLSQFNDVQNV